MISSKLGTFNISSDFSFTGKEDLYVLIIRVLTVYIKGF